MKHLIFITSLILAFGVKTNWSKGASWTAEEQEIIFQKVKYIMNHQDNVINQYFKLHEGYQLPGKWWKSHDGFKITPRKMLRLGFHDCLTYKDTSEAGGCDGCLNPTGMFQVVPGKDTCAGENINATDNNGLTHTADILEEVFTNPDFPKGSPSLGMSMEQKGMSRADLWAFASLVAVVRGVSNNNAACMENTWPCGHMRKNETDCKIEWPRIAKFKTGRSDCTASANAERRWHASKTEKQPNPHGNGPTTVDFMKEHFGMDAIESIALILGAHSNAMFHNPVSAFRYEWTKNQRFLFNNQMVRHVAMKEQYSVGCKDGQMIWTGDSEGNPGKTSWMAVGSRGTKNGGPFHWFHVYNICPGRNSRPCPKSNEDQTPNASGCWPLGDDNAIDDKVGCAHHNFTYCFEDLEPGMHCQPECVELRPMRETALSSDVGFYMKFEVNSGGAAGRPEGCDGLEYKHGRSKNNVTCPMEDYAPEGVPLNEIVEHMADDQQLFMEVYLDAHEKMINNGYSDDELDLAPRNDLIHPNNMV